MRNNLLWAGAALVVAIAVAIGFASDGFAGDPQQGVGLGFEPVRRVQPRQVRISFIFAAIDGCGMDTSFATSLESETYSCIFRHFIQPICRDLHNETIVTAANKVAHVRVNRPNALPGANISQDTTACDPKDTPKNAELMATINPDGSVTICMKPEVQSVSHHSIERDEIVDHLIRDLDFTVTAKAGETAMVLGRPWTRDEKVKHQVPILRNLLSIGGEFCYYTVEKQTLQTLVILTPWVIESKLQPFLGMGENSGRTSPGNVSQPSGTGRPI